MFPFPYSRTILTLVFSTVTLFAVSAGPLPEKAGPDRTIKMFELFCYDQMPNIDRIATIAKGNFTPLKGAELEKFQPSVKTDKLKAWKWDDFGSEYILATSKSVPDEAFKKTAPAFADSISYACSFFPKNQDSLTDLLSRMEKVMKRKADQSFEQKPFKVHNWFGVTDKFMVQVYYYAALSGKPVKLMSVLVFEKKS